MSAYVVEKHQIDTIITAALHLSRWNKRPVYWWGEHGRELHKLTEENASEVGRMLRVENIMSVGSRYPNDDLEGDLPGRIGDNTLSSAVNYEFQSVPTESMTTEQWYVVLNALAGYEYQTCEHSTWRESEAREFIESVRSAICSVIAGQSPGRDIDNRYALAPGLRARIERNQA